MSEDSDTQRWAEQIPQFDKWFALERELRIGNRHFLNDSDEYFRALVEACLACKTTLSKGTVFYRARTKSIEDHDLEPFPITEMRQPPPEKARRNRLNPEGIPCFYAARDAETAIAEVRPWRTADVTVATFTSTRDIEVIDLRNSDRMPVGPSVVAYVIGRPVHPDDRFAYLGSQYLAEKLKADGADGILYDSALGPPDSKGNVALFCNHRFDGALTDGGVWWYQVEGITYVTTELLSP